MSIRFTRGYLLGGFLVGGIAFLLMVFFRTYPGIAAGIAVLIGLLVMLSVNGHTAVEWIKLRLFSRGKNPQQAIVYGKDRLGLTRDDTTSAVYFEVTPKPFHVTAIEADSTFTNQALIPIDQVRRELQQYDILTSGVEIHQLSQRSVIEDEPAAVISNITRPTGAPLGGRTIVGVRISLDRALDAATVRQGQGTIADGVAKTAKVASGRVQNAIQRAGLQTKTLTSSQTRAVHAEVLTQVRVPLSEASWGFAGLAKGIQAVSFVPQSNAWKEKNLRQWFSLPSHRTYMNLSLSRLDDGRDSAKMLVTYVTNNASALNPAKSYGLRKVFGKQREALTEHLIAAQREDAQILGKVVPTGDSIGFDVPAGPLGVYIGTTDDRQRLFVNVSSGGPEVPLYLIGDSRLARQFVFRLSGQSARIDVLVDDPEWEALVSRRDSNLLTYQSGRQTDVVVLTEEQYNQRTYPGRIHLIVTDKVPEVRPEASIVAAGNECVVTVRDFQKRYPWETSPDEARYVG